MLVIEVTGALSGDKSSRLWVASEERQSLGGESGLNGREREMLWYRARGFCHSKTVPEKIGAPCEPRFFLWATLMAALRGRERRTGRETHRSSPGNRGRRTCRSPGHCTGRSTCWCRAPRWWCLPSCGEGVGWRGVTVTFGRTMLVTPVLRSQARFQRERQGLGRNNKCAYTHSKWEGRAVWGRSSCGLRVTCGP